MVFTIVQNVKPTDFCYTTSLFKPVLLPFYSEYNDYGAGENSAGIGLPLIIEALSQNLVEMEQGENQYHDIPVKRVGFDEEKYWNAIHENRLQVLDYSRNPVGVQFVMFHKRVVDHILANFTQRQFVVIDQGQYEYVDYTFSDVLASLPRVIEVLIENSKNEICRWNPLSFLRNIALKNNLAADYLAGDSYRYSRLINIEQLIREFLDQGAYDLLTTLLIEHLTAQFIDSYMMIVRKSWIPGCHEGSQSCDDEPYRALMSAMTAVLDADAAKYAEEDEEDIDQLEMEV
jgi:hypothetical protein